MKFSRLIFAAGAALWALAACNEIPEPDQKDPENETPAPEIQVAKSEVSLQSDGTSVDLAYIINNPVEGQKISVINEAEWLTVSTAKARVLSFSADLNETGAVRETQVVLSYEGAENVTIEVSQDFFVNPLKISDLERM